VRAFEEIHFLRKGMDRQLQKEWIGSFFRSLLLVKNISWKK